MVENVVAGNIAIISRLRQLRPRATVIVQSLLPAESSKRNQDFIIPINQRLEKLIPVLGPKVRWLNIHPLFVTSDGGPSPELFRDGVHPNVRGYEVWLPQLTTALHAIQSDSIPARVRSVEPGTASD